MNSSVLSEFIRIILEGRSRKAHLRGGKIVEWGADEHVLELEDRISELCYWRDKQKKGSESRANYSRLIERLKSELRSAKKQKEKRQLHEND